MYKYKMQSDICEQVNENIKENLHLKIFDHIIIFVGHFNS